MVLVLFVNVISVIAISTFSQLFNHMIGNIAAARPGPQGQGIFRQFIPRLGQFSCLFLMLISLSIAPESILFEVVVAMMGSTAGMARVEVERRPHCSYPLLIGHWPEGLSFKSALLIR